MRGFALRPSRCAGWLSFDSARDRHVLLDAPGRVASGHPSRHPGSDRRSNPCRATPRTLRLAPADKRLRALGRDFRLSRPRGRVSAAPSRREFRILAGAFRVTATSNSRSPAYKSRPATFLSCPRASSLWASDRSAAIPTKPSNNASKTVSGRPELDDSPRNLWMPNDIVRSPCSIEITPGSRMAAGVRETRVGRPFWDGRAASTKRG